MARDPLCRICKNAALLDAVDAAVRSGERPASIARRYAEQVSRSSVYRHVSGHLEQTPTTPRYLADGETEESDVLLDLALLRKSLIEQRNAAIERGQFSTANSTAQRIESLSVALLKVGADDEKQIFDAVRLAYWTGSIRNAALRRPALARELAAGVLEYRSDGIAQGIAQDLERLAEAAEQKTTPSTTS